MAEAIQFDLLEEHKENIQQLPSGRSAKALARVLSPRVFGNDATLDETKLLNDALRQEYENELLAMEESDDPLDIYVRYVRWTLKTYPSAQSTPQSQLVPLLERATNAFLNVPDMKDDPRYLKLWLQYIQFVSTTPRETYAFLARHSIGEKLALFYEEFAGWLEGAGRRQQADEIYRLGTEREARPVDRLNRKYREFQARCEAQPSNDNEPSSPAVPVRAALAAKFDPFSSAPAEEASQQQRPSSSNTNKPKKPKMAIFSDADAQAPPPSTSSTNGWNGIGSMKERKKENTIEAQPWAGQTLKAGKKVGSSTKMEVFKDPNECKKPRSSKQAESAVNPRTGRQERAFVNMNAVQGENGEEYSFEELRALHRGWTGMNWKRNIVSVFKDNANAKTTTKQYKSKEPEDLENLTNTFHQKLDITEPTTSSQDNTKDLKPNRQRKTKVKEIKQETQTVKLRDSPSKSRKPRKKAHAEQTLTLHSKSAHNDIYNMFNTAARPEDKDDTQSGVETDLDDDTFSIAGESTCTGRMSITNSEYGDETMPSFGTEDAPWSDFTTGKISKVLKKARSAKHKRPDSEDRTGTIPSQDKTFDAGFDTQAIADLANQDFGEFDTMAIARIAGTGTADDPLELDDEGTADDPIVINDDEQPSNDAQSPIDDVLPSLAPESQHVEVAEQPRYVPPPPEDYEPSPMWSFRDPQFATQNKLPYMTPIVEQTESSLPGNTLYQNRFAATKTPSRVKSAEKVESPSKLNVIDLLLESPQPTSIKRKNVEEEDDEQSPSPKKFIAQSPVDADQKILFPVTKSAHQSPAASKDLAQLDIFRDVAPSAKSIDLPKPVEQVKRPIHKGPIIQDLQCNPCDDSIIEQILKTVHPAPSSYSGFHDHGLEYFGHFNHIKAFTRKIAKQPNKSSPRKSQNGSSQAVSPELKFAGGSHVYAIKKELGEGAFAPVFLVESVCNDADEQSVIKALKAENEPKTLTWEFHILHLLQSRLGRSARSMESIILADECHLYRDECYLVLEYHSQGTILDLVNQCRAESIRSGKTAEGLEEPVAMWLSAEFLRTVEDMHKVGILHGDLKADNCLVRLNPEAELTSTYNRHGQDGWSQKGMTLIDFGRGIDTRAFKPEARFIADWAAGETDCPEIREAKPWKWEIDLFGAAGVIHSMLFGKYIETVSVSGGGLGQKKEWKLREGLKRYWEKNIWAEVFSVLINGSGKKEDEIRKDLRRIRGQMEDWLEQESERNGRDLRAGIRRCERLVCGGNGAAKAKR